MVKRNSERRPRKKLEPITKQPAKSQFIGAMNLFEIAFWALQRHKRSYTTAQISGAIRATKLKNDDTRHALSVRGVYIPRQQTCVLVVALPKLEEHLIDRWIDQ